MQTVLIYIKEYSEMFAFASGNIQISNALLII